MSKVEYKGLGRRKTSIARVRMVPGTGKVTINSKIPEEYFPNSIVIQKMEEPLVVTKTKGTFDVQIKVLGGGFTGQSGAISLGITRALINANAEYKKILKAAGLVTRDARVKERKKYGLYGARRSPQFTKR